MNFVVVVVVVVAVFWIGSECVVRESGGGWGGYGSPNSREPCL